MDAVAGGTEEPLSQAYGLPAQHKARPSGALKGSLFTSLQTPYQIKLTACTRKHLNINITDTGKGNNRRWQAPGGQRGQRANSAGRFRHDCTRKSPPSGKSARRCRHRPLHIPRGSFVKYNAAKTKIPLHSQRDFCISDLFSKTSSKMSE